MPSRKLLRQIYQNPLCPHQIAVAFVFGASLGLTLGPPLEVSAWVNW